MVCNAWYSVREFHVHLSGMQEDGKVRDGLERAILTLSELSSLPANASKVEIKNEIAKYQKELYKAKEQLTFPRFAENQYTMYTLVQERPAIHKLYENCWRDNLHSIWAGQELYRPGNSRETFDRILEKNMRPVYDSAMRQGYEVWVWG